MMIAGDFEMMRRMCQCEVATIDSSSNRTDCERCVTCGRPWRFNEMKSLYTQTLYTTATFTQPEAPKPKERATWPKPNRHERRKRKAIVKK